MEEATKEKAMMYMANLMQETPPPSKFSFALPESRETACYKLLGMYGAEVAHRDVDFRLDDATILKVDRVVKWMYESKKRGLLLCGTLGNGKTTMLRAIKRFFNLNISYFEAQDIYNYFKQTHEFPYIGQKDILLIDELGIEPQAYNDFGQIRYPLAELLLLRYKQNRPTIIATNCTFEQIGERYGERLKDRMKEMYAVITYKEPSYRG